MSSAPRVRKVMTQAINLIFEFLKNRERIQVWLYENTSMKIEGIIIVSAQAG
jgi:small nuclear ribonucleoprotein E